MTIVCPEVKWVDGNRQQREGFYLDEIARQVGDAVVDRVKERKQDTLIIFNGREGSGKTGAGVNLAYYMSTISGRTFTNANIFFDLKKMMEFASTNKEQIIFWDESALGGLANDWTNQTQKKLNAFLMVCRKLRHIFIFNVPRFYRLSPNIIERTHVMFHMFEDKNEKPGNFILIGQQSIEELYHEWRSTRKADYFKYKKCPPGHFSWMLPHLINEEVYEHEKDEAIKKLAGMEMTKEPTVKTRDDILLEAWEKNKINKKVLTQKEFSFTFGISPSRLRQILSEKSGNRVGEQETYLTHGLEPSIEGDGGDIEEDYNSYVNKNKQVNTPQGEV